MQAYEGYMENNQFFPFGEQKITGRQRVTVTVLSEEEQKLKHEAEQWLLAELEKGRKSAEEKGWLTADEVDALLEDI
jgi:hypothetical protein